MVNQDALKQIIQKIKDSSNILITVSTNPSVDELSGALAISLVLNKLGKHATAVFSGAIPPAIKFLEPDKTFENTVDSLRDFIIALDKDKADHLRYKVVDDMVKIFITPYRTTINENDLEFSQGDYNVEFVLAIGVKDESDLDKALTSHGKILHDATVATVSLGEPTKLGGIEWVDGQASSFSEMLFQVAEGIKDDKRLIDDQIANAFLTGIVASTDRFSNDKTTPNTMNVSAQLMSFGANQQLVATKLESESQISSNNSSNSDEPAPIIESDTNADSEVGTNGALSISHMPQGNIDEVTKQIADDKSKQALNRAEQSLGEHKSNSLNIGKSKIDQQELAEQKLAEQLPQVNQNINVVAGLADNKDADLNAVKPVSSSKLSSQNQLDEPMLGGTLNATTEQAEDDNRKQIEADRNRTILSHGGNTYANSQPSFQSPINASSADNLSEPSVRDIFAGEPESAITGRAETVKPLNQPPTTPEVTIPTEPPQLPELPKLPDLLELPKIPTLEADDTELTLAEIDAKNRTAHQDALTAIDAALGNEPVHNSIDDMSKASSFNPLPQNDGLPPLPPMPDFSTLPPLPGGEQSTDFSGGIGGSVPDFSLEPSTPLPNLPTELPPMPSSVGNDPAQFKIPGQN